MTRPIPDHGTYARANGSWGYREPCTCEPCKNKRRATHKIQRVNRELGRPALTDAKQAAAHLNMLHQTVGWADLATRLNGSRSHLRDIANGRQPNISRATHDKIMSLTPERPSRGLYIDATGTVRRVRALTARGHTLRVIADSAGSHASRIQVVAEGHPCVRRFLAEGVAAAYKQLSQQQGTSTRSRNRAAALGWAPPAAWDDDTIDDPAARPEWTGFCGTDHGYWTHRNQKLPMCPPCAKAHEDWVANQQAINRSELGKRQLQARAAAAQRGADIAEDARELMRLGHDAEQAAARLGITRQHLQQAMVRHPKPAAAAA